MLKAIAFGLAVGAAVQGFRNFPSDGPATPDAVGVLFVFGLLFAYLAGRARRGTGVAVAVASASAEAVAQAHAQQSVQVAIVVPGGGAHSAGVRVPDESAAPAWMGSTRPMVELDQLDGMDAGELIDSLDAERAEA